MTEGLSRERQAEPDGLRRYRDTCAQHTHTHTETGIDTLLYTHRGT